MTTFYIKGRRTSPDIYTQVDAPTREEAIAQAVKTAAPGEEIEVTAVQEIPFDVSLPGGPTGATGATGPTGTTGTTGTTGASGAAR